VLCSLQEKFNFPIKPATPTVSLESIDYSPKHIKPVAEMEYPIVEEGTCGSHPHLMIDGGHVGGHIHTHNHNVDGVNVPPDLTVFPTLSEQCNEIWRTVQLRAVWQPMVTVTIYITISVTQLTDNLPASLPFVDIFIPPHLLIRILFLVDSQAYVLIKNCRSHAWLSRTDTCVIPTYFDSVLPQYLYAFCSYAAYHRLLFELLTD